MEQPHGSLDDLHPQDLSTSSTVIDLTRKEALKASSVDGRHPNTGTSNPSETSSSDASPQSGDQIQPHDAFNHTPASLSYTSRSQVLSHNAPSPLYAVPPVDKFSLHTPCEAEKGVRRTGYAPHQHYLEHVDRPLDLATQTELFHTLSQVVPVSDGLCLTQQPHQVNGVVSSDGDMVEDILHSAETETGGGLENGCGDSWLTGVCAESPAGKDVSEVVCLTSKNQEPVVNVGARELCPLSREYKSPLEDPISPSATSLDDVDDVFILPQASSSPSGDKLLLNTADQGAWDDSSIEGIEGAIQLRSGISDTPTRLDSADEEGEPVHNRTAVLEPLIDLTDDVCLSDISEDKPPAVIPRMNGNAKTLQRTLHEKKLPMRSGRGMRLEAIVMNINSSRYKVSGCIRTNKNAKGSQRKSNSLNSASEGKSKCRTKVSLAVKTKRAGPPLKGSKTNSIKDRCKDSTSDSEITNSVKKAHSGTPPQSPPFAAHKTSENKPEDGRSPRISPTKSKRKTSLSQKKPEPLPLHVAQCSPPAPKPPPKKSPAAAKVKATGRKTSAGTPKRRRKKKNTPRQSSAMFAPKEPEIKLKYVNYKEEKRDVRLDTFSPFVHVERQQSSPSLCTVVNYPEEERTHVRKGQQPQSPSNGFISAVVPSTSCLHLGRVSNHSQHRRSLVCCLCGLSANAMDLGDLHGPYYPEGYQLSTKTPACMSDVRRDEGDFSDSDSSSCSVRGRGRKCSAAFHPSVVTSPTAHLRPAAQLKKKSLPQNHQWTGGGGSLAAKRPRAAGWPDVEDWYSAPVLPQEPSEYWLHEDCGIWSAGVFLVKGKVYGLEEAFSVAQETMCSACASSGATLGCFFKGCPNKYHYRCALQSDCVLIEENFSMKCRKHKNKTFRAPGGNHRDDR